MMKTGQQLKSTLVAALLAAATLACAAAAPGPAADAARLPAPSQVAEYVLGAGDVIRINVYQSTDLSLETRIAESGVISYPLLGSIRLGGLTVTEAERLIADGLRKGEYLKQPQVTIVLTQVRGNQASVLGLVNRPGRYPIEVAGMRLSELLALAGGVAINGADMVVLTGVREGKPLRVEVDLPTLFSSEGQRHDLLVAHGDSVWVDRYPQVYIYGEVQRPGALRMERGMTVLQCLASGGGLTLRGTQRSIRVHRMSPSGQVQVIVPALDDRLQPGDVVYVPESLF